MLCVWCVVCVLCVWCVRCVWCMVCGVCVVVCVWCLTLCVCVVVCPLFCFCAHPHTHTHTTFFPRIFRASLLFRSIGISYDSTIRGMTQNSWHTYRECVIITCVTDRQTGEMIKPGRTLSLPRYGDKTPRAGPYLGGMT